MILEMGSMKGLQILCVVMAETRMDLEDFSCEHGFYGKIRE